MERRVHSRKAMQFLVQHMTVDGVEVHFDYASDLSIGGLFLTTEKPLPAATRFQVQFSPTKDERIVSADCVVTHSKRGGMGVQFQGIDADSVKLIESIVSA